MEGTTFISKSADDIMKHHFRFPIIPTIEASLFSVIDIKLTTSLIFCASGNIATNNPLMLMPSLFDNIAKNIDKISKLF